MGLEAFPEEKGTPVVHCIIYPIPFVPQKRFTLRRLMAQGAVREILRDCLFRGEGKCLLAEATEHRECKERAEGLSLSMGHPPRGTVTHPGESRTLSSGQRQEEGDTVAFSQGAPSFPLPKLNAQNK